MRFLQKWYNFIFYSPPKLGGVRGGLILLDLSQPPPEPPPSLGEE